VQNNKDNAGAAVAEATHTSPAASNKSQNGSSGKPVSESDYLKLTLHRYPSRLYADVGVIAEWFRIEGNNRSSV
jgi:hypothetical protein